MKLTKRVVTLALVIMLIAAYIPFTSATEGGPCTVTFNLRNESDSVIEDDIYITLISQNTDREYTVTIKAIEYNYGIPILGTIPQGSVYDVVIEYKSSYTGFYKIVNEDGSDITTFIADKSEAELNWKIIFMGNVQPAIDTMDEEAPAVWQAFMDCWNTHGMYAGIAEESFLFDFVEDMKTGFSEHYEKYCGKPREEWMEMTVDEQTLVWLVWILPNQKISAVGAQTLYFKNESDFLNRGLSLAFSVLKYYDEDVSNAYKDLMLWQYDYIIRHGKPYNFVADITERNTEATMPGSEPTESVETAPSLIVPEETQTPTEPEPEKGFWEKTFDPKLWSGVGEKLMNNILTIILLVASVVALGVVWYIRKKKNIDGEDADNE